MRTNHLEILLRHFFAVEKHVKKGTLSVVVVCSRAAKSRREDGVTGVDVLQLSSAFWGTVFFRF